MPEDDGLVNLANGFVAVMESRAREIVMEEMIRDHVPFPGDELAKFIEAGIMAGITSAWEILHAMDMISLPSDLRKE